jgi:hypothetical protein
MQAQQRKGGLKRLSSVPQKNAPPTTMGDRGWVGGGGIAAPFYTTGADGGGERVGGAVRQVNGALA